MNVKDELLKMFGEGMRVECSDKNKRLLLGLGIPVHNYYFDFDTGEYKSLSIGKSGSITRDPLYPTNNLDFVIQGIKDKLNEEVTEIQVSELDYEISSTIKLIENTSSEQVMDILLYHFEQLLNQKRAKLNIPSAFTG